MEEPTCEIHAFSYSSAISNEATKENPMYAMEESVSFGRFTTESLSWERWSTFNRNRYVEEAEKYSTPGSVKKKKAFLEAHFKKKATVKADASSPDQGNTVQEAPSEPNVDKTMPRNSHKELYSKQLSLSSQPSINDEQWVEKEDEITGSGVNQNDNKPNDGVQPSSVKVVELDEPAQIQPTGDLIHVEKQNPVTETESGLTKTHEFCLQESSIVNQENSAPALIKRNPPLSSYIPSVEAETSLISLSSPEKYVVQPPTVYPAKEMGNKSRMGNQDKKRVPFYTLINRKLGRLVSPLIKKIGMSSTASNKSQLRTTPKEKPKDRLCQSFCFGPKLQSNSPREE